MVALQGSSGYVTNGPVRSYCIELVFRSQQFARLCTTAAFIRRYHGPSLGTPNSLISVEGDAKDTGTSSNPHSRSKLGNIKFNTVKS